jgi:glycosyltransferase involved in cell wall biosynthesis
MSYPMASRNQKKISKNVDYWCRWADAVIPAFMGPDGFGRWDVLIPNTLSVDLRLFPCRIRKLWGDFKGEEIVIVHAPNHRGFKGTEFIIESINQLRGEGFNINLLLLEKMKNSEVREILLNKADILIDQVVCSGHGLNAVEGMAAGLPTISNLENDDYVLPMKRWSYFGECPLVSASPENLVEVLRKLIERPDLRKEIGIAGRAYVEKYHGLDSSQYLFCNVIDYVYGKNESIINLYHPLLGKYPNRSPKIKHPLVNNRIID